MSKKLYVYRSGGNCVTHDGYIQLGWFPHTVEKHKELSSEVEWVETYWLPDIFMNRYQRPSFQSHVRAQ
jgi:hypothetical protein